MRKIPHLSVVVITYNSASTIARTLESLFAQDYPKNKYEVIVIDDGSTDDTPRITALFPVRYFRQNNSGISKARNSGIRLAHGKIYVCMDDDTVASPAFLRQLASGYETKSEVAGVGGSIADRGNDTGLTKTYIAATGRGTAAEITDSPKTGLVQRFFGYLRNSITTPSRKTSEIVEVEELYGANCSFPIEILKAVGGWDPEMNGIEDRDLCYRIKKKFPNLAFVSIPSAKIAHDPELSLGAYLLRGWRRGPVNLALHRRMKISPPIFPFPIIISLVALLLATVNLSAACLALIVLPQIFYFWWQIMAYREVKPMYLLFPYIQALEETMVIIGLLRGYLLSMSNHIKTDRNIARTLLTLLPFVWLFFTTLSLGPVWNTAVSLPFLLIVPGYNFYRSIVGYTRRHINSETLMYSVGLSILLLMGIGFLVNEIGLFFHLDHPLTVVPLSIAIALITSVFGLIAAIRRPVFKLAQLNTKRLGIVAVGLLLPLLAVGGAITLNNGGSNVLAILALSASAVTILLVCWKLRDEHWLYPYVLYIIGLTVLLGTSMRGWNITGHDIMQEFQVFQLTSQNSVWHMHFYQDAYNACLSITILPTVLQRLTDMPGQYVYKFAVQLYFALLAPIIYLTLRRYVRPVMAFLAGIVFITFPTFITDMAMLNRQETAFLFLSLAVLAALDSSMSRRSKCIFSSLFLSGMVFSHYSTSYITVAILVIATIILFGAKLLLRLVRKGHAAASLGSPVFPTSVVIVTILVLIGWNTLATQTSNNISATISGIVTNLPNVLTASATTTAKPKLNSKELLLQYEVVSNDNRNLPSSAYYPADTVGNLVTKSEPVSSLTALGTSLQLTQSKTYDVFESIKQGYAKLIQVLILLGIGLMMFSRKAREKLPIGFIIIGISCLVMIGIQVLLPSSLINYGLLRLIQQSLVFLAFPVVAAGYWILERLRIPQRFSHRIVAILLSFFFLILAGVLPALTGGYKANLPLSNSGFYYEAYYTHQDEITADQWLLHNSPIGSHVFADEFSRRQMITYSGIFATPTLVPSAIPIDSYVYLSNTNTTFNDVPVYYGSDLIFHQPPDAFLDTNKNLIYSTGSVKIYH